MYVIVRAGLSGRAGKVAKTLADLLLPEICCLLLLREFSRETDKEHNSLFIYCLLRCQ
jgi:hypothetical protein